MVVGGNVNLPRCALCHITWGWGGICHMGLRVCFLLSECQMAFGLDPVLPRPH